VRVSAVDKAFGATFVDLEDTRHVTSLAYKKGGVLHMYLKGEGAAGEVEGEIDEVFREVLRLEEGDVEVKDRQAAEYQFTVLNTKKLASSLSRLSRKSKEPE